MRNTICSIKLKIGTNPGEYPPGPFISSHLFLYGKAAFMIVDNLPNSTNIIQNEGEAFISTSTPGGFSDGSEIIITFSNVLSIEY